MAEVTINYKDAVIATMDASGTKTLQTQGKYCENDIEVVYARPSGGGGGGPTFSEVVATSSASNAQEAALLLAPNPASNKAYYIIIKNPQSTWVSNQLLSMTVLGTARQGCAIRWRNSDYNILGNLSNQYDVVINPGDTFFVCEADLAGV